MLGLLEEVWRKYPDMRLGQLVANLARDPHRPTGIIDMETGEVVSNYRDPFNVEDDEMWSALRDAAETGRFPGADS